jgi:hypothetical protein
MKHETVSGAREFWIEQFKGREPNTYKAFTEKPDILTGITIKINDGDPIAACEYFHVIEYSALTDLQRENERLKKELYETNIKLDQEKFSHMNCFEHWHKALDERDKLQSCLDKAVAALEFYADPQTWNPISMNQDAPIKWDAEDEFSVPGKRASEALAAFNAGQDNKG